MSIAVSLQRQDRYERKLAQGHKSALLPVKVLKESHSIELKKQICDMIKNGKKMSYVVIILLKLRDVTFWLVTVRPKPGGRSVST